MLPCISSTKIQTHRNSKQNGDCQSLGEGGNTELFNGYTVQFYKMKKTTEFGYTAM